MTVYGGKVNDSGRCWEDPRDYDKASVETVGNRKGDGRLHGEVSSMSVEGADVKCQSNSERQAHLRTRSSLASRHSLSGKVNFGQSKQTSRLRKTSAAGRL